MKSHNHTQDGGPDLYVTGCTLPELAAAGAAEYGVAARVTQTLGSRDGQTSSQV